MAEKDLDGLLEKIKNAFSNLVTLEILTAVGQIKFPTDDNPDPSLPDLDIDKDPKVILTKIDLLQGDIKTVYDPEFITGKYQVLKEFHKAREEQGHEIIKKNIEVLRELLGLVMDYKDK